jgi:hypothetical protein
LAQHKQDQKNDQQTDTGDKRIDRYLPYLRQLKRAEEEKSAGDQKRAGNEAVEQVLGRHGR